MKKIEVRPTSRSSAGCNPIVLRESERVRLVFQPILVDNPDNPKASVDGCFVYQRKTTGDRWSAVKLASLSGLRAGEGYQLALHAQEVRTFVEEIVRLYRLHGYVGGVPRRESTFMQMDKQVANLLSGGDEEVATMFHSQPEETAKVLLAFLRSIATSPERLEATEKLFSMAPDQLPSFAGLIGLAGVKNALSYWKQHQANSSEDFWQSSLAERAYVLSQLFAYPAVIIQSKAYVGGKRLDNKGGKVVDFLMATEATSALLLAEIKTPQTKLLGSEYRPEIFPLSSELTSSVAQVLRYRQDLMRNFDNLTKGGTPQFSLGEPRCVVIAGDSAELKNQHMKESFELQRERMQGVTIVTYDELFLRLERLISLLEGPL